MRFITLLLVGLVGALWCYADARRQASERLPEEFNRPTPLRSSVNYSIDDDCALVCDSPDYPASHRLHASIRSTLPLDPFSGAVYCRASYPTREALAGGSPC